MYARTSPLNPSGLQDQLDAAVTRLIVGTTRRRIGDAESIVDDVERVIREHIVSWALEHSEPVR